MKKAQPIKGFKVMDWLRNVREEGYKLYKEDPQEYHRQIRIAGEKFKKLIITEKALYDAQGKLQKIQASASYNRTYEPSTLRSKV